MSEEIFDVVNERDEVIGRAPRREVHARGLWHRAVHVLVFNARGEVFLQKRSLKKDTAAGRWDSSSSGHVDAGEAYDDCAVRELREEIGLVVAQPPARRFKIPAGPAQCFVTQNDRAQKFFPAGAANFRNRQCRRHSGRAQRYRDPAHEALRQRQQPQPPLSTGIRNRSRH